MTLHARTRMFHLTIQAVVVASSVVGTPQPICASQVPRIPRVRDNGDPSIAKLIQEATERSVTFLRLVDTIDATDGIVYVEQGHCGHHVRACLALTAWVAGPSRILRIVVDTHRDRGELLASIGHELQHAVEAIGDPHVTNAHTMYSFFDRIGPTSEGRFETEAAIHAGMDVLAEWRTSFR
jgi:hypothetical protein